MQPYATASDLATFTGTDAPDDADRQLARASELLDDRITAAFAVNPATGLPTDVFVAEALKNACCAQVEFWTEVGEEGDIAPTPAGTSVTAGKLTFTPSTSRIAPRAVRYLRSAGMTFDTLY